MDPEQLTEHPAADGSHSGEANMPTGLSECSVPILCVGPVAKEMEKENRLDQMARLNWFIAILAGWRERFVQL
jgi:hypothetical protein